VQYLPLQVGQIDGVKVDEPKSANSSSGKVKCDRRPEPSRPYQEHARSLERALAFFSNLRQENVAAVANQLFAIQLGRVRPGSSIHTHDIFRTVSVPASIGR
jgi:hypothetical protein